MSAFKAPLDPSTALGGFSGSNYSQVIFLMWSSVKMVNDIATVFYVSETGFCIHRDLSGK